MKPHKLQKGVVKSMKYKVLPLLGLIVAMLVTACTPAVPSDEPATLTVLTHDSFAISEAVIAQFEAEHGVRVEFVRGGDTGTALNQAILTRENPLADVFFGVDNTFLTRALDEELFIPYDSPLLAQIPDAFKIDPENRTLPVDYGDVCINYDKAYFAAHNLPIPAALEDLTDPQYAGLLVVQNPATSSPGLAFLMATIAHFGEDGYLDFWRDLKENGLVVVSNWETAYYTNFSGSTGQGPQPMVVSYGSSPAAEVIFAETELDQAPTGSIIGPNTCFRQIEFVGILANTANPDLARTFIDFMLSVPFQEDIPLQMFVFPVNPNASLPEAFIEHVDVPDQPASLPPELIEANREAWINAWLEAVLD
jgi:thiamine transport system substrate-binding protein